MGRGRKKRNNNHAKNHHPQQSQQDPLSQAFDKNLKISSGDPIYKAFTTQEESQIRNAAKADIIVRTEDQDISAHKCVLSKKSEHFRCLISEYPDENIFVISCICTDIMKLMLNFMYTDYLEVEEGNAFVILEASLILRVKPAIDHCFRYLTRHNPLQACVPTYLYAKNYNITSWAAVAQRYIIHNFDIACNEAQLYELNFKEFIAILQDQDLFVTTETIVYLSALRWLYTFWDDRKKHAEYIMSLVRYPQLNLHFLKLRVRCEKVYAENPKIKSMVEKDIAYKMERESNKEDNVKEENYREGN